MPATNIATKVLPLHAKNRRTLAIIVLAITVKAFLLFVALPLFVSIAAGDYHAEMFPDQYDQIAWNLATGNGYRVSPDTSLTMIRSPGFVLILAAVFLGLGKSLFAVKAVNLIFSIGTATFVFLLTKKIFESERVAWAAAFIVFFFPGCLIADSRAGVESALMLFIASTFFLAYKAEDTNNYCYYVILGVVFGFCVTIKGTVALMLPAFWLCRLAIKMKSDKLLLPMLARYSISAIVVALVSVPWIVRNYEISGQFVPTMSVGGLSFDQGVYVIKNYTFHKSYVELLREADYKEIIIAKEMGLRFREEWFPLFYDVSDELAFYKELENRALGEYYQSPLLIAKAILINSVAFWFQGRTHTASILNIVITLPMLVFFLCGIVVGRSRRSVPIVAAIASFIIPHLFIISLARYYIPIVPLMAPFVAVAADEYVQRCWNFVQTGLASSCSPLTWFCHRRSQSN
jgi:4-amino-4-deoxy-L-arabinose transferase-like glycosyltransferase